MPASPNPAALAQRLLKVLARDLPRLEEIDRYHRGEHADPYMPDQADAEYRLLAERCVSNWMPLLASTPCQALYVDSFRPGRKLSESQQQQATPEWNHWQRSRMDARQLAVHRGALIFGHSFVLTEKVNGKVISRGLSAMRTAAVFEDVANDETPYAVLTVTKWPQQADKSKGRALMWDGKYGYEVSFTALADLKTVRAGNPRRHGASECPVTRFAAYVDLEGRTTGVIEPMIPLQDRINQTVFDLLVAQTGGSFKVRTVTGMAPPTRMKAVHQDPNDPTSEIVDYEPELDGSGRPIPEPININAKKILFAEDADTKFGQLDETPLDGYINSIDMSIRHLSAIAQVPPHHLLGQIANLSAEALQAAETSLLRMVEEFQRTFGESWERVFRIAAELDGDAAAAEDFNGEVVWRDMEQKSMAQAADALGKLSAQLGIPQQGLWSRVPNVTQTEIEKWNDLKDNEPIATLAGAVGRATTTSIPRQPVAPAAPAA